MRTMVLLLLDFFGKSLQMMKVLNLKVHFLGHEYALRLQALDYDS